MTLLLHIIIALSSIIISGIALAKPSRRILGVSYALIIGTLASGTYLVALAPSHLPSACVSGLLYLAVAGTLTTVAQRKFAAQANR